MKIAVLTISVLLTGVSVYGCLEIKKLFGKRLFLNDAFISYDFVTMSNKYYDDFYKPLIYIELDDDIEFFDEEV